MNLTTLSKSESHSKSSGRSPSITNVALLSSGELYGGVEQFLYVLSTSMKKDGVMNPIVVLFEDERLASKLRAADQEVEIIPERRKYDVRIIWDVARLLRRRGIGVLHCHGYKATIIGSLASVFLPVKVVKTVHGWVGAPGEKPSLRLRFNDYFEQVMTRLFVKKVIYITRDLWERKSKGVHKKTSVIIPTGISFFKFKAPSKFKTRPSPFTIGIIGRLAPIKGHEVLFEALQKLKQIDNFRINVIGDGPLASELKLYVRDLGLENCVMFYGFCDNMVAEYEKLDCLVMPSFYEGLPLTVLEAMRAGVPIIASKIGGLKEILLDNQTALLFPAGQSSALALCLEKMSSDDGLRHRLAANAYQCAVSQFNIEKVACKHISLYQSLYKHAQRGKAAWLTWDRHRRSVELSKALKVQFHVFDRGQYGFMDPLWPLFQTFIFLFFHRHKLIIVQNPSLLLTTLACALKPLKSYVLVQDLHSYFIWHMDQPRTARDWVYRILSKYCIRRCNLTIVTNDQNKEVVEKLGGHGFVLQDKFPDLQVLHPMKLQGHRNIVYVCTFSEDEPLKEVIEAAKIVGPLFRIFVTGKIKDSKLTSGVPSNITFTDFMPEDMYFTLMRSCDAVMVLTTRENTLLCGAYEAIALSKPLILSRTHALQEYFYKGVVFSDNDPTSLAISMKTSVAQKSLLEGEVADLRNELEKTWRDRFAHLKSKLGLTSDMPSEI